ncbi:MAG: hypothetical protein KIT33_05100 [Candidatus Kapabacteria bacterium]|nr:hypothetical protein [Ignavibacteriota bacterium]MCW5884333.1 hypothetical protein [Candidatus Kapabacteria bacterium]
MWKDKIVVEVRNTREKILIEANYDISAILRDILKQQNLNPNKVVSFASKSKLAELEL